MTDQNLTTPKPEPVVEQPTATAPEKTGGKTYTDEQVEQIIKDRLARQKDSDAKKAKDLADKAVADAAAASGEWEKVAKAHEQELLDLKATLKAKELADLKRDIAAKIGLPANLALRLVGETAEDIEKDAKTLLDTLPKAPKPNAGTVPNPGAGAETGETREARLKRLHLG